MSVKLRWLIGGIQVSVSLRIFYLLVPSVIGEWY